MFKVFLNFWLPLWLGFTFKGFTGLIVFLGAFLYLVNQYLLLKDRVKKEFKNSWWNFLKSRF